MVLILRYWYLGELYEYFLCVVYSCRFASLSSYLVSICIDSLPRSRHACSSQYFADVYDHSQEDAITLWRAT